MPDIVASLPLVLWGLEWVIRLALIPSVIRRHAATPALAWLTVIFFMPYVGLFAYVLLGRGPLARARMAAHTAAIERVGRQRLLDPLLPHVHPISRIPAARRDVIRLATRIGRMPIVTGNEVSLLPDSEETIESIVRDIEGAKRSVHMLYYIFRADEVGERVAAAVARAARRGVACRLLMDAVGATDGLKRLAPGMRRAGADVRAALPVRLVRGRLARIDMRDHRKLTVVDGHTAHCGSQNIALPTYGQKHAGPWRDLSARVRGPAARQLQVVFLEAWAFETGTTPDDEGVLPEPESAGDQPVQCVPSGPGYPTTGLRDLTVDAIYEADRRVVLTSPYLVPDEPLMQALRLTAMGRVQVDLIVPARGNHRLVEAAGRSAFEDLLEAGVRIHLHDDGLLHAKTLTVDETIMLMGSGNLDIRSFFINFELTLLMYGQGIARQMLAIQNGYIGKSRLLTLEEWRKRGRGARVGENLAKLFGPLL